MAEEFRTLFERRLIASEEALERLVTTAARVYGSRGTAYERQLLGAVEPHFSRIRAAWTSGVVQPLGPQGHPTIPSLAAQSDSITALEQLLAAGQWLTAVAARDLLIEALSTWDILQGPFGRVRRVEKARECQAIVESMQKRLETSFNSTTNEFGYASDLVGYLLDHCLIAVNHVTSDYRDLVRSTISIAVMNDLFRRHPFACALAALCVAGGLSVILISPR